MKRNVIVAVVSLMLSIAIFNMHAQEIEYRSGKLRTFVTQGSFARIHFDEASIPTRINARRGNYRSPYYVVHYGLKYSEACRTEDFSDNYHWIQDSTAEYWLGEYPEPTVMAFKRIVDWLHSETEFDEYGNAHLFYDFEWPYPGYSDDKLTPKWWSGLTEGRAITLFLRAYDCFNDSKYLQRASEFYRSVTTSVEQGGSLLEWDGMPWIEEYVDSATDHQKLSRVLNGMAYAYFGIKAYEMKSGFDKFTSVLAKSIQERLAYYDLGGWSLYDAIGNRANIKYHFVNWSLIKDPRLSELASKALHESWSFGVRYPVMYFLKGPKSFGYFHLLVQFTLFWLVLFVLSNIAVNIFKVNIK